VSGVSSLIFPPLAGVLVVIAWHYPFLLYSLAIPSALPVYLYLEEPSQPRGSDQQGRSKSDKETGERTHLRAFVAVFFSRDVLLISLGRGIQPVVFYSFMTYISFIVLRGLDGTPTQSGILIGIYSFVMAIAASQSGRIVDVFGNIRYPLLSGHVLLGVGIGLVAFAPSFSVALVGTITVAVGNGPVLSLYRSIITDLTDTSLRGSLVSTTESLGRITATATPILLGVLVTTLTPLLGPIEAVRWSLFTSGTFATGVGLVFVFISVSK
jgi:cyanate permease